MIYLENHCHGRTGLNNHVLSYTFCIALSNFLDREFYFDYEIPTNTLPEVVFTGPLKEQLQLVSDSNRSLVSDLLDIPTRRVFEIDRQTPKRQRIDDPMLTFMTDAAQKARFGETMIWNFFSLGRTGLIREALTDYDLIEFGNNCIMNASFYFFLERQEKNGLLDSIRIRYRTEFEQLAEKIISTLGHYNAIHLRLGDFKTNYAGDGFKLDPDGFGRYVQNIFGNSDLPLMVATDEFQDRALFENILEGFKFEFIDEIILRDHFDDFRLLPFTDFNVLSILDQLICAASDRFAGTCRSTFSSVIHRLRQERHGKLDFNFFPDGRVSRHLNSESQLVPDSQGFFEWNRYSAFAEHYEYPAWMREWNYALTAV